MENILQILKITINRKYLHLPDEQFLTADYLRGIAAFLAFRLTQPLG